MTKPLIIYHKNCDDGFGAAYAAWKKLGDAADYLPLDYNDDIAKVDFDGRDVTALDFCFSPEDTEGYILPRVNSLSVVDHHLSAMDGWKQHLNTEPENGVLHHKDGKLDLFFDMDKSGAYLAWQHYHAGADVPRMIRHISDIDLWRFALDGTRDFSSYLRSQPRSFEGWDLLCRLMQDKAGAESVLDTGRQINGFYNQQLDAIVAANRDVEFEMSTVHDGKPVTARGIAVNASKIFASELGNTLALKSGSFAVVWETDGQTAFCSMRSVPSFDCIPFAAAQGGGGHAQACGFKVPLDRLIGALRGDNAL